MKRQIISELDTGMPELVRGWRNEGPVVIDSHAVTSERWGLRSIPYSPQTLLEIGISHVVCLSADAATLRSRIEQAPEGRPVESPERLEQLDHAQVALAMAYAHTLGAPAFVLDATRPLDAVQSDAAECCDLRPRL